MKGKWYPQLLVYMLWVLGISEKVGLLSPMSRWLEQTIHAILSSCEDHKLLLEPIFYEKNSTTSLIFLKPQAHLKTKILKKKKKKMIVIIMWRSNEQILWWIYLKSTASEIILSEYVDYAIQPRLVNSSKHHGRELWRMVQWWTNRDCIKHNIVWARKHQILWSSWCVIRKSLKQTVKFQFSCFSDTKHQEPNISQD